MNSDIEDHIKKSKLIFKNYCIDRKYKYKNNLPKIQKERKNDKCYINRI